MTEGEYEFTELENKTIDRAAKWAKALGILTLVQAGLKLIDIKDNFVSTIVTMGIEIAIGLAFLNAGRSLTSVVTTQGNDIQHMMHALGQLGSAFQIRIVITIIAGVFVGIAAIVGIAVLGSL